MLFTVCAFVPLFDSNSTSRLVRQSECDSNILDVHFKINTWKLTIIWIYRKLLYIKHPDSELWDKSYRCPWHRAGNYLVFGKVQMQSNFLSDTWNVSYYGLFCNNKTKINFLNSKLAHQSPGIVKVNCQKIIEIERGVSPFQVSVKGKQCKSLVTNSVSLTYSPFLTVHHYFRMSA